MSDDNRKPEPIDPAKMEKLLEIELMQKRMAWQQAKARRGGYRALAFLFLILVIFGAAVAVYLVRTSRPAAGTGSRPSLATPASTP